MRRRTATWTVFGACAALGAGVLAWLSLSMLALEQSECDARGRLAHELAVGDVLWRMDAWLAPILAQEAQRPVAEYRAFNPVAEPYTNLLGKLAPGEVVAPSPLLAFRSDLFPLHFEVGADGSVTSPQVPQGNELDVAQSQLPGLEFAAQRDLLARLAKRLDVSALQARCAVAAEPDVEDSSRNARIDNYAQRAQSTVAARNVGQWIAVDERAAAPAGQLVPVWFDDETGELLLFVRRVAAGGTRVLQGVVADWPRLREALLDEVRDAEVARDAGLVRVDDPTDALRPRMLTTVPAALETAPPRPVAAAWGPVRGLLVLAWLAYAGAVLTVGFTLRQALAFGERRARFASAVTHELRTPLTTFRMYSEILAKDMVRAPEKRREYAETLQTEADRLARLVENVLGYARIEDGRFATHREETSLPALIERHRPVLARRAGESGRALEIEVRSDDAPFSVDVDAIGQILFNLVDNACKHGGGAIELVAERGERRIEISVRDHGRGVAPQHRARIFAAFERGDDPATPGVGLGLALSRSLARDLGGELTVEDAAPGARFVLGLPV